MMHAHTYQVPTMAIDESNLVPNFLLFFLFAFLAVPTTAELLLLLLEEEEDTYMEEELLLMSS